MFALSMLALGCAPTETTVQAESAIASPDRFYESRLTVDPSDSAAFADRSSRILDGELLGIDVVIVDVATGNQAQEVNGALSVLTPDADPLDEDSWVALGGFADLDAVPDADSAAAPRDGGRQLLEQEWFEAARPVALRLAGTTDAGPIELTARVRFAIRFTTSL
ncbi:MAG: hypothetical protein AAF211_00310 [Myxococcota bacterium]